MEHGAHGNRRGGRRGGGGGRRGGGGGGGGGRGGGRRGGGRGGGRKFELVPMEDNFVRQEDGAIMLDGSAMEGGGQILRNGVALAALLQVPLHIVNIRAKRGNPGLRAQHLRGIQLVGEMCRAKLSGDSVGSAQLHFSPRQWVAAMRMEADTQTAGSVCLLLQVALPCAALAMGQFVELTLRGGTNAIKAPPADYAQHVLTPTLSKHMGVHCQVHLGRRGFFPKGGGHIVAQVQPVQPAGVQPVTMLDRGPLAHIDVRLYANSKEAMASVRDVVWSTLRTQWPQLPDAPDVGTALSCGGSADADAPPEGVSGVPSVTLHVDHVPSTHGKGLGALIVGRSQSGCLLAGSALLDRGQNEWSVAESAAKDFLAQWNGGGCVDEHMADQLIIFMALAHGRSAVRATHPLSLHTETAIHFSAKFTGAVFDVTLDEETTPATVVITCDGCAYVPKTAQ